MSICICISHLGIWTYTCAGTALASWEGRSDTLEKIESWLITDPVKTLTKKTFQIKKYKTLQDALFFLWLREINPSIDENIIITGAAVYRNMTNITLGRYPVTIWLTNFLHKNTGSIYNWLCCNFFPLLVLVLRCILNLKLIANIPQSDLWVVIINSLA